MNIEIINADRHRNGVRGRSFSVYLVDDHECGDTKVAIVFDDAPDCVAVLSVERLAEGDIAFASNSWRGDQYAWAISRLLEPAGR